MSIVGGRDRPLLGNCDGPPKQNAREQALAGNEIAKEATWTFSTATGFIAAAAGGAIIGDNIGFWVGRESALQGFPTSSACKNSNRPRRFFNCGDRDLVRTAVRSVLHTPAGNLSD